jgi:hypothetical protein
MKYIKLYEQREPERQFTRRADGSVEWESWWLDDALHREDGPAHTKYRPNGSIESESWYLSGKLHREDGPAWIEYRRDGSVESESWWLEDEKVKDVTSQADFEAWQYLKSIGLV